VFKWTETYKRAFEDLKEMLINSLVLAMPRDVDPFVLDTDACDVSIGAVFSQVQDGHERVIACASRTLSRPEQNYCVTSKELLAVVFHAKIFRQYLLGRQFLIRTDHSALQWLRTTPEPIGQQARWCEILEEFDFQIVHRPGRNHGNADALSRRPCRQCGLEDVEMEKAKIRVLEIGVLGEGSRWSKKELAAATEIDPEIAQFSAWMSAKRLPIDGNELAGYDPITKWLHAQWERFSVREGVLNRRYWGNGDRADSWQVVLPVCYREEAMESAHQSVSGGHMGVRKTQSKLAMTAYWVGWTVDVREYCKRCDKCARYHRGGVKKQGMLQTMCVGAPWERVAIDITGPHPVSIRATNS